MKTVNLLVFAALLASASACKKNEKAAPKQDQGSAAMGSGSAVAPTPGPGSDMAAAAAPTPAPTPTPEPAAADTADWIKVYASHTVPKEGDPVEVRFERFKVVKAAFDPKTIEGGKATIEIDLTSLKTGDDKRDGHVSSPDYLDAGKFATATVDVDNVKKQGDKQYAADATVKFRGVEKKYPMTFEVVDAKDDWIRIKSELPFKRLDFKVGKKPDADPKKGDCVADELTAKLQLTLKPV